MNFEYLPEGFSSKRELDASLSTLPRDESERVLMSTYLHLCEAIDSPRALCCWLLFRNGEYAQLVSLEINPDHYGNAYSFADDYQVTKFLSKYPDFRHRDLDPEGKALESFLKFEELCKTTNARFRAYRETPELWDPSMREIFHLARRKISRVLGAVNLSAVAEGFGWGPGATTSCRADATSAYVKFACRMDVTSNTLMMGRCCVSSTPSWSNCQLQTDSWPSVDLSVLDGAFNVVRGNEVAFVPKNAKTHRIIAKEPHVNSYLQRGAGVYIRKRLLAYAGIDLKDQSRNQKLAKAGSSSGYYATLDLSGASDTISKELVKFLLPKDWYGFLSAMRSPQGYVKRLDQWIDYQKFSSMGNSYTFELETLIFWSLSSAVLQLQGLDPADMSVYGDDIIVPASAYDELLSVISEAGFVVNAQKSFSTGRFRESCGKDYFDGYDVRPIFQKEMLSNAETILRLANGLRRYAHRRSFNCGCDRRFRSLWHAVVSRLPKFVRGLRVPDGFGDIGLISNFDEAQPVLPRDPKRTSGWAGLAFRGLIRLPVKRKMIDFHAGYTACLSAVERIDPTRVDGFRPSEGYHDLRDSTYPRIARIRTYTWYDLGPWL